MEKLYQLGLTSRTRLPLFPDAARQRQAVVRLAAALGGKLVAFGLFAHGHLGALEDEARIGLLRRTVRSVLQPIAALPIEPVWCEVVDSRKHLRSLLRYWICQLEHHGLPGHPALWDGSCFLDLVGARRVPGLVLRCRELLPEVRVSELLSLVGLPATAVHPLDDARVRALGLPRIASAAAAALGLSSLDGKTAASMAGKRLVMQMANTVELAAREARGVLGVCRSTGRRLASSLHDAELHRAVRTRLAIEEAVIAAALPQAAQRRAPDTEAKPGLRAAGGAIVGTRSW
jgi:hypothetical protein